MCYAVTSMPPASTTGLKLENREEFELLEEAQATAEEYMIQGHSAVRVWKLHSTAKIERKVVWE
jgi:hypothetical protein